MLFVLQKWRDGASYRVDLPRYRSGRQKIIYDFTALYTGVNMDEIILKLRPEDNEHRLRNPAHEEDYVY